MLELGKQEGRGNYVVMLSEEKETYCLRPGRHDGKGS